MKACSILAKLQNQLQNLLKREHPIHDRVNGMTTDEIRIQNN